MKRIPFDRFSDKRFYYANAPPCKQGFSLTTDFTWRILLCTKKFLIRFNLLRINGISRIPRFMHTVPVFRILLLHSDSLSGHRLHIFHRVPAFLPVSLRFSDVSGHNPVVVLSIVFYLDIPLS
jgi:hypothetical protein